MTDIAADADTSRVDPSSDDGPLAAVLELFDAIIAEDIDVVLDHYEPRDDLTVFVEGPRWLTVSFDRVATGWRAFGEAPVRILEVRIVEGPFVTRQDAAAVVASIVDITSQAHPDADPTIVRMRMTHVLFQGDDGRWRTVHEHASQPLPDPYGSGDWLPQGAAGA